MRSKVYLVVRSEKHLDDKYWICTTKDDALKIAEDVSAYWAQDLHEEDIDKTLYGNFLFFRSAEDSFTVIVVEHEIRLAGDTEK